MCDRVIVCVTVPANLQRFQQDQEKYANDVVAFSNEIQTLEVKLKSRDSELTDTKKKLGEATEKYSDLKRRARHYKAHCQSKQVRKFSYSISVSLYQREND